MSAEQPTIIYTLTDEAPLLATYSFLPIIRTFTEPAGIKVETSDISVAARILAEFSDYLTEEQRVPDNLARLGELTQPGPGLWPFAISVVIAVLSVVLLITGRGLQDTERFSRASLQTVIGLVTLVALAALLPLIGFEIPALLLMLVWLRWLGKESWRSSIVISICAVAAFYVLFVLLLQIPLPRLI